MTDINTTLSALQKAMEAVQDYLQATQTPALKVGQVVTWADVPAGVVVRDRDGDYWRHNGDPTKRELKTPAAAEWRPEKYANPDNFVPLTVHALPEPAAEPAAEPASPPELHQSGGLAVFQSETDPSKVFIASYRGSKRYTKDEVTDLIATLQGILPFLAQED